MRCENCGHFYIHEGSFQGECTLQRPVFIVEDKETGIVTYQPLRKRTYYCDKWILREQDVQPSYVV